jgi:O-methyltransferase
MVNQILHFGKKAINKVLKKYDQVACGVMMALDRNRQNFVFENDYIRASSLELIANEIYDRNICGSVAELGVYRGDFAKIIVTIQPGKTKKAANFHQI